MFRTDNDDLDFGYWLARLGIGDTASQGNLRAALYRPTGLGDGGSHEE
jgi:hypothetical protein